MRVLAIRGRNLASLAGDFEVDFEAAPLADAGIFAITGPTGAGKSTLLDAMCLALFDTVPRLGAASRGKIENEQGDELSATDARTILRHGESDAFAEIDFLGRDSNRYRARWTVQRARMKPTGRLKSSVQTLLRIDGGEMLGGTKTETLAAIQNLVGLSSDQFRRAVLLAQGDFEAFIKANDNDRAVLLEKITGSTIYTQLGRAAFEKASALRLVQQRLVDQLQMQNAMDDAARADAEGRFQSATNDEVAADATVAELEKAARWEADRETLKSRLAACEAEVGRTVAAFEAAEPDRVTLRERKSAFTLAQDWSLLEGARVTAEDARTEVASRTSLANEAAVALAELDGAEKTARAAVEHVADQAAVLRPIVEQAKNLDRDVAETATKLDHLTGVRAERSADLAACRTAEGVASAAFVAAVELRDRHGEWLSDNAALALLSAREEEIARGLTDRGVYKRSMTDLEGVERTTDAELVFADDALSRLRMLAVDAEVALIPVQADLSSAEAAVPAEQVRSALVDRRDAIAALGRLLIDWRSKAARVSDAEAGLVKLRTDEVEAAAEHRTLTDRKEIVADTLPNLRVRLDEARRAGVLAEAAADDAALQLRALLVDGAPCPVCGATEHRTTAISALLGEQLESQRARIAGLEVELTTGTAADVRLAAELQGLSRQGRTREAEVARLSAELGLRIDARDVARASLVTSAAAVGFDAMDERFEPLVASALSSIDAERRVMDAAVDACSLARSVEGAARKVRDDARSASDAAADRQRAAAQAAEAARAALARARDSVERFNVILDAAFGDVVPWRQLEDPVAWLAERSSAWRTRSYEHSEALKRLPALDAALADARTEHATATALAGAVEGEAAKLTTAVESLMKARRVLLDGRTVADVETDTSRQLGAVTLTHEAALRAFDEMRQVLITELARKEGADVALAKAEEAFARLGNTFEARLSELSLSADMVAAAVAGGPNVIEVEEQRLAGIADAVRGAEAAVVQRAADLSLHEAGVRPEVMGEALQAALATARMALSEARTVLGHATFDLRRDDEVRAKTAGLRAELELEREASRVWLALSDLIGDREGKVFRRFAQGLTLDRLLSHANEQLLDLKPRFALERSVGGDMLIQVVDHDMAGEVRGVHNLSGGERFLISLALALGLAEMSTGRGLRIESLFIDEGFGALDTSSLGQAIAVLEHLHATGRRVGVISHVEEVKERIPVKIEVVPVSRGKSVLTVSTN